MEHTENEAKYKIYDRVLVERGYKFFPASIVNMTKERETLHNNYYYEVCYTVCGFLTRCKWVSEYNIKGIL